MLLGAGSANLVTSAAGDSVQKSSLRKELNCWYSLVLNSPEVISVRSMTMAACAFPELVATGVCHEW